MDPVRAWRQLRLARLASTGKRGRQSRPLRCPSMNQNRYFLSTCALSAVALLCPLGFSQNTTTASASDKKFVHSALEGGNAEVKLGQLAMQKGNSEDVKQFGQKMVDDHTKMGEQMKQVAQQEGINVPDGIPAKDKALETKLNSLSGDAFDKAYIKAMVQDHRKDLRSSRKKRVPATTRALRMPRTRDRRSSASTCKWLNRSRRSTISRQVVRAEALVERWGRLLGSPVSRSKLALGITNGHTCEVCPNF